MRSGLFTKTGLGCIAFLFALLCAISANAFGQQRVIAAEYFFDQDPGPGMGTAISVTPASSINATQSGSIASLSKGQHTLFARTKNQFGVWGAPVGVSFLIPQPGTGERTIAQAEYFFNTDPGVGRANPLSLTEGRNVSIQQTASIAGLPKGEHALFVRMKSGASDWGKALGEKFLVADSIKGNAITQAEYFVDVDPGEGKAALFPLSGFSASQEATTTNVSISGLSSGIHRMFVRFRDDKNRWGNPVGVTFLTTKGMHISGAEYFVDALGMPGSGRPMTALDSVFNGSLEYAVALIDTSIAKEGKHKIYMRVQGSDGRWSTTAQDSIVFDRSLNRFAVKYSITNIAFGNVRVGGVKDTSISISSAGKDTLRISNIVSTNAAFSVRATTRNLPPGQSFKDTVRFTPASGGNASGLLLISTNASPAPDTVVVSGTGTSATGVADLPSQIPKEYSLSQNYPNPFNPSTVIRYGLSERSRVKLEIYDLLGRVIATVVNGEQEARFYEVSWQANAPSGIYFYRIEAIAATSPTKSFVQVRKMVMLK